MVLKCKEAFKEDFYTKKRIYRLHTNGASKFHLLHPYCKLNMAGGDL